MPTAWHEMATTVAINTVVTILIGYGVRYVVSGLAGRDRASFGAFCFLLGAALVAKDADATPLEDLCHLIGCAIALIIVYRLWFGSKANQSGS